MLEIIMSSLQFIALLFSILFVKSALTIFVILGCLLLGLSSYCYFLKCDKRKASLLLLVKAKLSIILLGIPILFTILLVFESVMILIYEYILPVQKFAKYIPEFLGVFLTYGWLLDGNGYFLFLLDFIIYLAIGCSIFEYYILKENRGTVNSKKQIIKAVLFSNIPIALMGIGYFIYMYHTNPAMFR